MKLIFSPLAEKQLRKLPKIYQILIAKKIRKFQEADWFDAKALKGYKGIYRSRVGDYRIVYKKDSGKIYFILIGHRREIYLLLRKFLG